MLYAYLLPSSSGNSTEYSSVAIYGIYLFFGLICYAVGHLEYELLLPQIFPKVEFDSKNNLRNQIKKIIGILFGLASAFLVIRELYLLFF